MYMKGHVACVSIRHERLEREDAGMLLGFTRWCSVGVVAALAIAGCTHDRSELYALDPEGAGGASGVVEPPPWLPALPDLANQDACEACAKDKCATAHANCLQDDACVEMLACKGTCSDPGCLQTCAAEHAPSPWYDDLWVCVLTEHCAAPCRTGENFACAGNYNGPVTEQSRFTVSLRFKQRTESFGGGPTVRVDHFLVGAEVRTCRSPDLPCTDTDLIDSERVDSKNTVKLEWWSGWSTFLEIEDERIAPYGWRERILWPPPAQAMEFSISLLGPELLQDATGSPEQETRAPLGVYVGDCLTSLARGVRVELPDLPELEVGLPFGDALAIVIVADVPAADRADWIAVRAVQVESDRVAAERVVAEGEAFVRAGWNTHLVLVP